MDSSIKPQLVAEIYKAFEILGAEPELLSIIGSLGDTVDDATVLAWLKAYNVDGTIFSRIICGIDTVPHKK